MKYIFVTCWLLLILMTGCSVGHNNYISFKDGRIGKTMPYKEPFNFENSGKLIRADYLIGGKGLTHITNDEAGDLVYHFSDQEVLSNYTKKEWVGKCLTYYIVDSNTYVIKSWGFDKGGNPLSCRTWP
jgi:hypothetical protein